MVKVKPLAEIQKNYEDGISRAPANYKKGVQAASGVIEAAKAAESVYAQRMQEAVANQSRLKGLEKVTDADRKSVV